MKKLLFVCSENAGRSQMAEAFFNAGAKEKSLDWEAESAGTKPSDIINPAVIESMSEIGFDLSQSAPKPFNIKEAENFAKIISFGCLPKNAFAENMHPKLEEWHIDDPREKSADEIRKIRDKIKKQVDDLFEYL